LKNELEVEKRRLTELIDSERRQLQHSRDQSLREKEIFIAECLEDRKSLQEERLSVQTMQKDITKKDEEIRKRIREVEVVMESERLRLEREWQQLHEEVAACERERKALSELKQQLYEERRMFDRETQALTTIGMEIEQKSASLAVLHKEATEMKTKAEKDLAEVLAVRSEVERRELELQNGNGPITRFGLAGVPYRACPNRNGSRLSRAGNGQTSKWTIRFFWNQTIALERKVLVAC